MRIVEKNIFEKKQYKALGQKRLKIGIAHFPTLGGSGIIATELAHSLASKGHELHLFSYDHPFRLQFDRPRIHFHRVEVNHYELFRYPDYSLALASTLAKVIKEEKLDLIHAHYALPHAAAAIIAKTLLGSDAPPVVTTFHGTDITIMAQDPFYQPIIAHSAKESSLLTAVSESLKLQAEQTLPIDKPIKVIPNFFTPREALLKKKSNRSPHADEGEMIIIHSSNYRKVKRPEDLIAIFALLQKKLPCKLLLLGDGEGLIEIKQRAKELRLEEKVVYLGAIRDIDPYIASSDLMLLPSEMESFGLTALEAMAYGVPVVCSDAGGLPELVDHQFNGFIAPIGAVELMAEYGALLLRDRALWQKFSTAAMVKASKQYSSEKIIPKYEKLYKSLLNRSALP